MRSFMHNCLTNSSSSSLSLISPPPTPFTLRPLSNPTSTNPPKSHHHQPLPLTLFFARYLLHIRRCSRRLLRLNPSGLSVSSSSPPSSPSPSSFASPTLNPSTSSTSAAAAAVSSFSSSSASTPLACPPPLPFLLPFPHRAPSLPQLRTPLPPPLPPQPQLLPQPIWPVRFRLLFLSSFLSLTELLRLPYPEPLYLLHFSRRSRHLLLLRLNLSVFSASTSPLLLLRPFFFLSITSSILLAFLLPPIFPDRCAHHVFDVMLLGLMAAVYVPLFISACYSALTVVIAPRQPPPYFDTA